MKPEKYSKSKKEMYKRWGTMKSRCYDKDNPKYLSYGARGISICDRWLKFGNFFEDMENGYNKNLSLDRIDNNGNYCKENCRWATPAEQSRNRRSNIIIEFNGRKQCLTDWANELGLVTGTLQSRIYRGNSIEKAFNKKSLINRKLRTI